MPANLTPDYLSAEQEFKDAQTHDEKVAALEKMLSTIPKHKGTEKLQADIKRRLARMRKESHKGGARHTPHWLVKREGAGQVALIGPPSAGKSQLLAALTHAHPEVGDYPFTTRLPAPGMMPVNNVQIQLVDLPPVSAEFVESWLPQVIRAANLGVLVADPSDPAVLEEVDFTIGYLKQHRVPVPRLLVGNKADRPRAAENFTALRELYSNRFDFLAVSALRGDNLQVFARRLFDDLQIVRFYSKPPGKPADLSKPYVVRRGDTVVDAAHAVHKDFAEQMKFTRLYRVDGGHSGLKVERSHVVEDEDILEFHI